MAKKTELGPVGKSLYKSPDKPKVEPDALDKNKSAQPQTRAVQDMKDSRGKGSPAPRAQAVRVKGGKRRSGTPKGGKTAPPEISATGVALQTSGRNKGQPKPQSLSPVQFGGAGADRPQVMTREATASKASGPNDLEAARRVRTQVIRVMQQSPYKIPHRIASQRIGDLDYEGGGTGTFDVPKALSFLQAHEKHVQNNPRTNRYDPPVRMDHPWLKPLT